MDIHVARDGRQFGPYSLEEVRRQLAAGMLLPTDFVWTVGATGWVPLVSFLGLAPPTPGAAPAIGAGSYSANAGMATRSRPAATSGAAIASLIFAILSYTFVPFLGGIVAVICGHVARGEIRRSGGGMTGDGLAVAGLIIGYLNLAILPLAVVGMMAGIALPVFSEIQLRGKAMNSVSNARQIAIACRAYAQDHHDAFPPTLEELVPRYLPDRKTLTCPLSPGEIVGYVYFGGTTNDPPDKVLLMSKFIDQHFKVNNVGRRVIARVDGSCEFEFPPPGLPAPRP